MSRRVRGAAVAVLALFVEGDEAIVLTGVTDTASVVVAPTDLIIEDGPYLSFPKYIYGALPICRRSIPTVIPAPLVCRSGPPTRTI